MSSKAQQVQRTKNYDQFKVFDFNRAINKGLVNKLMESINEIGYMPGKPVIVDKDMAIIDGQHRFTACVNLGIEVEYVITDVDAHTAVIQLNAN